MDSYPHYQNGYRSHQLSHFTELRHWQAAKPINADDVCPSLSSPISCDADIRRLREQLKTLNAWPEAGDTFLELLVETQGYGVTLVPGDFDWLAQVAEDAYKGEDIGLRYPSIFQKLLTYPKLRQQFLQMLALKLLSTELV